MSPSSGGDRDRRKLIDNLASLGLDSKALETASTPLLAEFTRLVDGLRDEIDDANREAEEAEPVTPEDKADAGRQFFDEQPRAGLLYGKTREGMANVVKGMNDEDFRRFREQLRRKKR